MRSHYRLDLVKMTPIKGRGSRYLLALVHDEQVTPGAWKAFERITQDDLLQVREIEY